MRRGRPRHGISQEFKPLAENPKFFMQVVAARHHQQIHEVPHLSNLWHERVIGIGIGQQGAYGQEHLRHTCRRHVDTMQGPVGPREIEEDSAKGRRVRPATSTEALPVICSRLEIAQVHAAPMARELHRWISSLGQIPMVHNTPSQVPSPRPR